MSTKPHKTPQKTQIHKTKKKIFGLDGETPSFAGFPIPDLSV
jgi:hypothetical protein